MPFVALQGRPLQSATIGYAITPNPIRPTKSATRTKSFRLGGLTFEKTTPKVLFYGASGRDFYALWSFYRTAIKYSPKRSEFLRFNSYFCHVYSRILLFIFATPR